MKKKIIKIINYKEKFEAVIKHYDLDQLRNYVIDFLIF